MADEQVEVAVVDRPLSEAKWQSMVRRWAKDLGWIVYHAPYAIGADRGFPDLVLLRPPRLMFVELKSDKGKLRPEQINWLENLQACGLEAYVWRPKDEQVVMGSLL